MIAVPLEFWGWFLGGTLALFGVVEAWAIFRGRRDQTLTYWLRVKIGVEGHAKPTSLTSSFVFILVMFGFVIWFVPHIVLGWWGGA